MSDTRLYRLIWYDTTRDNKYAADKIHELLGSRDSILAVWRVLNWNECKHLEVYSLDGAAQNPEKGVDGLV